LTAIAGVEEKGAKGGGGLSSPCEINYPP